jgi:RPA family protein
MSYLLSLEQYSARPSLGSLCIWLRAKKISDVAEELSSLHNEVNRLQSHIEKIRKMEEEQTMRARAH